MSKSLFQVLDEMNQDDIRNNTSLIEVSGNMLSGNTVKHGCKITMGAATHCIQDIMTGKKIPLLVLIDKEEYFKRKS